MTTVGVPASKPWRVDALRMPSYNHHYHSFKLKQCQDFSAALNAEPTPLFRRVSADCQFRARQQLKDVNTARPDLMPRNHPECVNWKSQPATPIRPIPDPCVMLRLRAKEYARWRHDTTPLHTTHARQEWNRFLNRCPERFNIELPRDPRDNCRTYFDGGYALRYLDTFRAKELGIAYKNDKPEDYIEGNTDLCDYPPKFKHYNYPCDMQSLITNSPSYCQL